MKPFTESRHFRLEKVTDGIFAAISKLGTGALGNSAIIDLGDATLVVDTMMTIEAARNLRDAAESLFGKQVSYVFNTHWHTDHTLGNQVFAPAAQIIATSKTRHLMSTLLKERDDRDLSLQDEFYQQLQAFEEKMREEKDNKLRLEMQWDIGFDREYIKGLRGYHLNAADYNIRAIHDSSWQSPFGSIDHLRRRAFRMRCFCLLAG